ncbi:S-layer homology domain-containing protein [Brachybacterium huguangmaarense]
MPRIPRIPSSPRRARADRPLSCTRTALGLPVVRAEHVLLASGLAALAWTGLVLGAPAAHADDAVGVAAVTAAPAGTATTDESPTDESSEDESSAPSSTPGITDTAAAVDAADGDSAAPSDEATPEAPADTAAADTGAEEPGPDPTETPPGVDAADAEGTAADVADAPGATAEETVTAETGTAETAAEVLPLSTDPNEAPIVRTVALPAAPASAPAPATAVGFTDVTPGMLYAGDIAWAQSVGAVTGWPDGTFRPFENVERGAFIAMLFRLTGDPSYVAPTTSRFTDVATTDMFYREISWGAATGVTTGWSDGTFRARAAIDRDAALAMLRRVIPGAGIPAPTRSPFLDMPTSAQHYQAVAWGYVNGITTGYPDGTFHPNAPIARDATAAMLHRIFGGPLTPPAVQLHGPTGTLWSSTGGTALVGAPTGQRYVYGGGLRQDFQRGSIIHSPATGVTAYLTGTQLARYDALGGAAALGLPRMSVSTYRATTYQEFDLGGIYTTDGYTFTVTGPFFARFRAAGGISGYLGAPIGDALTGSTGISYQSFKGGQLTTPDYMTTPPPTTPSGGTPFSYPTLQRGSSGDKVYAVQVKLGIPADGKFGPQTQAALIAWQRQQGIPQTGIVDTQTWARIMSSPNTIFDGTNGRLRAEELTIIAPNWTLPTRAAQSFVAMQDAFRAATGRTFVINDAYRPIDRQIQLLVAFGRPQAAYPGTSNHGEARTGAVDISLNRGDVTYQWLVANASRFGWTQTDWQRVNEPWHWQYTF